MAIVATLLDKAKKAKQLTSDSALGTAVGTNRQVISQWRNGDSYPSEDNITALALMAGDDPVQWLVAIKAVRSEGVAGKYWNALAKRLAVTATLLAVVVLPALPRSAQAATGWVQGSAVVGIMRNVRDTIRGPKTPRKARKMPAVEASRFRDTHFNCNLTVPASAKLLRVSDESRTRRGDRC